MANQSLKKTLAAVLIISLATLGVSGPAFAHGGGGGHMGGGGHAGGGGYRGGGAHFAGGGFRGGGGGYRGGYGGYRGGYGGHGSYGGRGGYGYRAGYGGWGWGGVGLGLGLGLYYATIPFYYSTYWGADGSPYYYADDNYYQWNGNANEYETVSPPQDVQRQAENQTTNLMAYPKNGQSVAQQAADKSECQTWAAAQSGFNPTQGATAAATSESANLRSQYRRADAACLEGHGYSVK